jgi:hypothetical protein
MRGGHATPSTPCLCRLRQDVPLVPALPLPDDFPVEVLAPVVVVAAVPALPLAVVYCLLWLFVAAEGGGIWSLDALIRSRRAASA